MKRIRKLKSLQELLLELLIFFDKICRENNIKYSLCGGTCLGAVRHKGFIPWDDDADVMMLREEYDKFVSVMEKQQGKYKLLTHGNNKDYYYPYGKLIDTSTTVIETNLKPFSGMGVFLDVFPIDIVPENKAEQEKFMHEAGENIQHILDYIVKHKHSKKKLDETIYQLENVYPVLDAHEKLCRKYSSLKSNTVGWPCWNAKIVFSKNIMEELIETDFCGHNFYIPKAYDEILTIQYGDYMTIPPRWTRYRHKMKIYKDL